MPGVSLFLNQGFKAEVNLLSLQSFVQASWFEAVCEACEDLCNQNLPSQILELSHMPGIPATVAFPMHSSHDVCCITLIILLNADIMCAGREAMAAAVPSSSTTTNLEQTEQQASAPAAAPSQQGISAGQGIRLVGLGLAFAGLAAGVFFGGRRLLASSLGDKGKQVALSLSAMHALLWEYHSRISI